MCTVVVLEWKFSPPDYFESPIEISWADYTMKIANGKAEAKINSATYEANSAMRDTLHNELNDRFLAAQLLNQKKYDLSRPAVTRIHPNGRRDLFMEVEPITVKTSMRADLQILRDGKVVSDPKQERIDERNRLADRIIKYRAQDGVLAALLKSHKEAFDDPNNELVHLYEIRDALSKKFGVEKAARTVLKKISHTDWSRFGKLCNEAPLKRGRHRGKFQTKRCYRR
jgi:hypothetical protein